MNIRGASSGSHAGSMVHTSRMSTQPPVPRETALNTSHGAATRCSTEDACVRSLMRLPPASRIPRDHHLIPEFRTPEEQCHACCENLHDQQIQDGLGMPCGEVLRKTMM